MISLKSGVKLSGLRPELVLALLVVKEIFANHQHYDLVVTSANDGTHGPGSLHHRWKRRDPEGTGCSAIDVRTHSFGPGDPSLRVPFLESVRDEVTAALGDGLEFDVVLEDAGGPNEHLHVEFDP